MRKMIRRIGILLSITLLLGGISVAAAQEGNVYDDAGLLSAEEIGSLNETIAALEDASGWNVYAVTTNDAGGKSAMAYADDFFDSHSPEQEDGITALIDMDNREIWLSGCGEANRYLTDDRIDMILDDAYYYVSEGDYAGCLEAMVSGTYDCYEAGIVRGQYNYDSETGQVSRYRSITWMEALVALLIACGAGALVVLGIYGKYRLKFDTYKYEFREFSNVSLREKDDRFINQTVTHRRIPRQTPSGGGGGGGGGRSTTHRSSSGRSHVGGGRKF